MNPPVSEPELRYANPYLKSIHRPDQVPAAAAFGSDPSFLGLNRRPNCRSSPLTKFGDKLLLFVKHSIPSQIIRDYLPRCFNNLRPLSAVRSETGS